MKKVFTKNQYKVERKQRKNKRINKKYLVNKNKKIIIGKMQRKRKILKRK